LLTQDLRLIEIEVATKVRANEAELKNHPVVKGLNRMVKEILTDSVEYKNGRLKSLCLQVSLLSFCLDTKGQKNQGCGIKS
jgi:hypothetical protein